MLDAVTDLLTANGTDRRVVSSVEPSEYRPLLRCGSPGPTKVGNGSMLLKNSFRSSLAGLGLESNLEVSTAAEFVSPQ
jgi:hypothetical protein